MRTLTAAGETACMRCLVKLRQTIAKSLLTRMKWSSAFWYTLLVDQPTSAVEALAATLYIGPCTCHGYMQVGPVNPRQSSTRQEQRPAISGLSVIKKDRKQSAGQELLRQTHTEAQLCTASMQVTNRDPNTSWEFMQETCKYPPNVNNRRPHDILHNNDRKNKRKRNLHQSTAKRVYLLLLYRHQKL